MPVTPLSVFVSATTQDLGSCRAAIKEELLTAGILPVTQENFGPDYQTLVDFIRLEVSKCDAVICLVGDLFGYAPEEDSKAARSYTQLEYDYAIKYGKPLFIYVTDDDFVPDRDVCENEIHRQLQTTHRSNLLKAGHKLEYFSNTTDVRLKVAQSVIKINQTSDRHWMHYLHLPRRPSYFSGRSRELEQIHASLLEKIPSIVVVMGMGGQGKTTLVYQALLDRKDLPYQQGFWCTAYRGGFTFDMFLDEALDYLTNGAFDKRSNPDITERSVQLLGLLQKKSVLLVIDGMERWLRGWSLPDIDPQEYQSFEDRKSINVELDDFLEQVGSLNNGTHLIITTRALPAAIDNVDKIHIPVRDDDAMDFGLEGLDPTASASLLQSLGVNGPLDQLVKIADSYANHPLALTVLGTLLYKRYGGAIDKAPKIVALDPRHELHRLFDEVKKYLPGRELAEQFLTVASLCFENPSLQVIAAGLSGIHSNPSSTADDLLDMAVTLADWNLLAWDPVTQQVSLHPLLKNYFSSLSSIPDALTTHQALSNWYGTQTIDNKMSSSRDSKYRILSLKHSISAGDICRAADTMFLPMTHYHESLYDWISRWGHQQLGIELLSELADTADGELRGNILLAKAQLHQQLGRPQLSLEGIEETITIFESLQDTGSDLVLENLAKAIATRGDIHRATGSSRMAVADYNRAIDIHNRISGSDPRLLYDRTGILVNRGNSLRGCGALSSAIASYDQALELCKLLPESDSHTKETIQAPTRINRGNALLGLGKPDLAIVEFTAAISDCLDEKTLSWNESRRHIAHARILLGTARRISGLLDDALDCTSEAVKGLQSMVDSGRTDCENLLALGFLGRAKIFNAMSRWADGLNDGNRAVLIYQRLLSEAGNHYLVMLANCQVTRAITKYMLGDIDGSREDRVAGLQAEKKLCLEWGSECDVYVGYLRDLLSTMHYLLPDDAHERFRLLEEYCTRIEQARNQDLDIESIQSYLTFSASELDEVIDKLGSSLNDKSRLDQLTIRLRNAIKDCTQ